MNENLILDLLDIKQSIETNETIHLSKKFMIINKLNTFLIIYCKHEIITDYIDITPDKGCNIKYCIRCGTTFA